MLNNKKGFELSINMIVVMILGLVMLGVGFSIFYGAYNEVVQLRENVDSQTQRQLNDLLDTGEAIVIPITSKEADRGDYVDFDIGISNELGKPQNFFLYIRFGGYIGQSDIDDVNNALNLVDIYQPNTLSCRAIKDNTPKNCADKWILLSRETQGDSGRESDIFENMAANVRKEIPIRIVFPRKIRNINGDQGLPSGQYVFNVDVFHDDVTTTSCHSALNSNTGECPKYFSRKKMYVTIR